MTARQGLACVIALALAACGGRSDLAPAAQQSGDAGVTHEADAGACVDIDLSSFDPSCSTDSDCMSIYVGEQCPDTCATCAPNAAINLSGDALYESETAGVRGNGTCGPCIGSPPPRCIASTCTLCPVGGGGPPGCGEVMNASDAGTGPADSGVAAPPDGGFLDDAGEECVDIDPNAYDPSCQVDTDCIYIETGAVCSGTCGCGGNMPVNVSGEARFEQAISGLTFADCPCIALPPPVCVSGTCLECSGSPNDPPECGPDGG